MKQRYKGILPYDESKNFEFAGRSEETWALYDRVARNEYTVYYAASGEGKTSLIRAGLLPILRRRNFFPIYIVFTDEELGNSASIETVICNRIERETKEYDVSYKRSEWSKKRFNEEQSEKLKSCLWWQLRNYCFIDKETELTPLFIFDQFEEVFTKTNYDWTNKFFAWLEEISTNYPPKSLWNLIEGKYIDMPTQKNFKALFSFRTEYLGDLDYWCVEKHFLPALQENRLCLKSLTPKGAKEVIGLNESLKKYSDKIIQGCAETQDDTTNENQPCVYALILSVVCHTLSEKPDNERGCLLNNLEMQQDETIDAILFSFYKKKLETAGLDYAKDEKIIDRIENALVDEKGKRCRRDTDEKVMAPLLKWIEKLSDKNNGLLKIIGEKTVGNKIVTTVEFPHDRLCKAIDSFRKERQGKILWNLNRQREWMQFGIISAIVLLITILWNSLMPTIKFVLPSINSKEGVFETIKYILKLIWNSGEKFNEYSLDGGVCALHLMVSMFLFIPLITTFIIRKTKKGQLTSCIISALSLLSFLLIANKCRGLVFDSNYVPALSNIGILCSTACLCTSALWLKKFYRDDIENEVSSTYSYWPLWGGYFIFVSYVFHETLFRSTFGINEPKDSCWALVVLPLLYSLWAWGFFNMNFNMKMKGILKKRMSLIYLASILCLISLAVISGISYNGYNGFKQKYGFIVSVGFILLWIIATIYIVANSCSKSHYYVLSKSKRIIAIVLGSLILIVTYILNLGYNPTEIAPNTVCYVFPWRSVIVSNNDSTEKKKLGVVYSTDAKEIIPCCIDGKAMVTVRINKKDSSITVNEALAMGRYPFSKAYAPIETLLGFSLFEHDTKNVDLSLDWKRQDKKLKVKIVVSPTLEQYLHKKSSLADTTFNDSIEYYAANLFREIRNANILYATTGKTYNLKALKSIGKLDSLQQIALSNELERFSHKSYGVLEDNDMVDFYRELARSFLIILIKDRVLHSDIPSMFTLSNTYPIAYFTSVECMSMRFIANVQQHTKTPTDTIYSDDILNKRFFAYYDLFNALCYMDMGWNSQNIDYKISLLKELPAVLDKVKMQQSIMERLKENHNDPLANIEAIILKQLKTWDNNYDEAIISQLEKTINAFSFYKNDLSLQKMITSIFEVLLPKSKTSGIYYKADGIYNNAFENICKKLIQVSIIRGYDIKEHKDSLSKCIKDNNDFDIYTELADKQQDFINSLSQTRRILDEAINVINEYPNRKYVKNDYTDK